MDARYEEAHELRDEIEELQAENAKLKQTLDDLYAGRVVFMTVDERDRLEAENAKLKQLLRDAKLPYSLAIFATPSGPKRNKLTEMNLLRLDALKGVRPMSKGIGKDVDMSDGGYKFEQIAKDSEIQPTFTGIRREDSGKLWYMRHIPNCHRFAGDCECGAKTINHLIETQAEQIERLQGDKLKPCVVCDAFNENDRMKEQIKAKDEVIMELENIGDVKAIVEKYEEQIKAKDEALKAVLESVGPCTCESGDTDSCLSCNVRDIVKNYERK